MTLTPTGVTCLARAAPVGGILIRPAEGEASTRPMQFQYPVVISLCVREAMPARKFA
jgi:hypothetical protein